MKRGRKSRRVGNAHLLAHEGGHCPPYSGSILAFGAHPDDIEFGCGGVIAVEARAGRTIHFVICSKGEAGTNGTPSQRVAESHTAANILGATLEFIDLDGDAHLEERVEHAIRLAGIIRKHRPAIVMAPTLEENQHPDHARLGRLVRDAARLARYGGLRELKRSPAHAIDQLLFYAIAPDAEPMHVNPILVDISDSQIVARWKQAMEAHDSQMKTRSYVELQLARARVNGLRAGVENAIALYPNDPLVVDSLSQVTKSARCF